MLEENAGCAAFQRPQRVGIGHPRGHHEDVAGECAPLRLVEKQCALLFAEIVIEKHDIDGLALHHVERFRGRGAASGDAQVRLSLEQPAEALAKEAVIVDQQDSNRLGHARCSPRRRALAITLQQTSSLLPQSHSGARRGMNA